MAHPMAVLPEAMGLEPHGLARPPERHALADELEHVGDLDRGVEVVVRGERALGDTGLEVAGDAILAARMVLGRAPSIERERVWLRAVAGRAIW